MGRRLKDALSIRARRDVEASLERSAEMGNLAETPSKSDLAKNGMLPVGIQRELRPDAHPILATNIVARSANVSQDGRQTSDKLGRSK